MSVYFARVGAYVKIGHSDDPRRRAGRLRSDDTGRPLDLDKKAKVELLAVVAGRRRHRAADPDRARSARHRWRVVPADCPAVRAVVAVVMADPTILDNRLSVGCPEHDTADLESQQRSQQELERLLARARRRRALADTG